MELLAIIIEASSIAPYIVEKVPISLPRHRLDFRAAFDSSFMVHSPDSEEHFDSQRLVCSRLFSLNLGSKGYHCN
jgi:hypothetical protein